MLKPQVYTDLSLKGKIGFWGHCCLGVGCLSTLFLVPSKIQPAVTLGGLCMIGYATALIRVSTTRFGDKPVGEEITCDDRNLKL